MGAGGEAGRREARLTRELAAFLARSRWQDLPDAVRREGKRAILNVAGCVIAGREDPAVRILQRVFPDDEALGTGAAATAYDYDDTHLPTVIHTGPPVAGALFALARTAPVSGAGFLHAFILGVETSCRVGNAVMPGHYERGWHITSTCGVFGATAAAGKVLGLNENQFSHALGIAATQAAGLVEVLGSMARVLNAGFAARSGLRAAQLAAAGFEGPAQPLEGLRGFMNVFGGNRDAQALSVQHWEMTRVAYKPYPCGVVLHALVDGCLEHREKLREAEALSVSLHPLAKERADRPNPRNALEARLSAQHAVAACLVRGRAGRAEFSDAAALDPELAACRRRVVIVRDERLDKMAAIINDLRCEAARPMDDARLAAKLRELAGPRADEWMRVVGSLESAVTVSLPL